MKRSELPRKFRLRSAKARSVRRHLQKLGRIWAREAAPSIDEKDTLVPGIDPVHSVEWLRAMEPPVMAPARAITVEVFDKAYEDSVRVTEEQKLADALAEMGRQERPPSLFKRMYDRIRAKEAQQP